MSIKIERLSDHLEQELTKGSGNGSYGGLSVMFSIVFYSGRDLKSDFKIVLILRT